MKVKIIRNTVANGLPVEAGEEIELSESEAKFLIVLGKAMASPILTPDPSHPHPSPLPEGEGVIETADAVMPKVEKAIKPRANK